MILRPQRCNRSHTRFPYMTPFRSAITNLGIVRARGAIAHAAVVLVLGLKQRAYKFGHGAMHVLPGGTILADSYHCSRYNTNTGRITEAMFHDVFRELRRRLDAG